MESLINVPLYFNKVVLMIIDKVDEIHLSILIIDLYFIGSHENDSWKKNLRLPPKDHRPQTEASIHLVVKKNYFF